MIAVLTYICWQVDFQATTVPDFNTSNEFDEVKMVDTKVNSNILHDSFTAQSAVEESHGNNSSVTSVYYIFFGYIELYLLNRKSVSINVYWFVEHPLNHGDAPSTSNPDYGEGFVGRGDRGISRSLQAF